MSLWTSTLGEDPLRSLDLKALLDLDPEELQPTKEWMAETEKRVRPYRTRVTPADLMTALD